MVYVLYNWLKEKIFLDDNLDICIVDYTVITRCAVWLYSHSLVCCAVDHSSDNSYWYRCDIFIYWWMVSIIWLNSRNTELWLWSLIYYSVLYYVLLLSFNSQVLYDAGKKQRLSCWTLSGELRWWGVHNQLVGRHDQGVIRGTESLFLFYRQVDRLYIYTCKVFL